MLREERDILLLKYIRGRDAVSYEELLSVVDSSPATLRRDVDRLADSHRVRKVRGGVAPVAEAAEVKPLAGYHFGGERARNAVAKRAIARKALELVAPDDTLILFSGSTVAGFAERLPEHGLSVLTNSLPVAVHLSSHTANRVYLIGGEVFAQPAVVLSPFPDTATYTLAASQIFVGCHGVCDQGLVEEDSLPIHVFRCLRKQAERLVVLADSSKFGQRRSLILCRLEDIDVFVTDDGISDKDHQRLIDAGVRVLIAPVTAE
jgi:DeoR family ulaG and ulaABCDEF operon transcriptional repressor